MGDGTIQMTIHRAVDDLSRWLRLAASVLYTAAGDEEAFQGALDLVCTQIGWPLGHAFRRNGDGHLVPVGVWHDEDPERHALFVARSTETSFDQGVGLPGRVAADHRPAWVPDVRVDDNFPRRVEAAACGLGAGLGLPIVGNDGLLGVLEFFSHQPAEPDPALLEVLAHVGFHLGGVLDRVRAQGALRRSEEHLRSLVESVPDALFLVDEAGVVVQANAEAERLTGYPRAELVGLPVEQLVPDEARAHHAESRRGYAAHPRRRGMGVGLELVLRRRDGSRIPVEIALSPLDGSVTVASARDLTERRRAKEALDASRARLEGAERLGGIGSWTWNLDDGTVAWSAEMCRILGLDPEGEPPKLGRFLEFVYAEDRDRVRAAVEGAIGDHGSFELEHRVVVRGEVRWHFAIGRVVDTEGGPALEGYCRDITVLRAIEDRGNRALQDLDSQHRVLEGIARGERLRDTLDVLCRDVERTCPGAMCSVLLADEEGATLHHAAAPTLPPAFCRLIDGLPIAPGSGACGEAASGGHTVVVQDILANPLTSSFVELARRFLLRAVWSLPLLSAAGDVLGTFAVYRRKPSVPDEDEVRVVTSAGHLAALAIERHLAQEALARAADIDPLTGLANRARFLSRLAALLAGDGPRVAVMFLDLDRFKWINDSLGHPAGDRVLVEVAARFAAAVSDHTVARFGGDEFTVLVEDATDERLATAADAVRAAFAEPFVLDGGEFFLSVSVGIARNDGEVDAYGLVRDADAAMYAAKDAGRDRHVVFDESLRRRALARVTLESELRRGIERDELVPHFQPIADLRTAAWAGAEALVRWQHPVHGLTGPDTFIPLAEETGLIVPLGGRVLEGTIARAAGWAAGGSDLRLAVNVSVVQLSDPMLAPFVGRLLERYQLDPGRLVLEVTESALMERLDDVQAAVEAIADLGVRLVIDDFGTGYSSIARLRDLPVVGVKIDRSLTLRLGTGSPSGDLDVVAAVTDLAHALGLYVVAEGVETPAGLDAIRRLGCDFAQGFLLARPLPAAELPAALARPVPIPED
ncbi:MAG TPA: EAL domain-containing protein [Acidimicrobiales bacterium]|nr:EAL domain-containing protein [Acidimicrobiales bacterium]